MKTHGLLAALVVLASFTALDGYAQISVRSSLSDDREAVSGMVYDGSIQIKNETGEPQQAKIYQTDYLFFYDGTNLFGEPGSTPRSNAGWIQFSPSVLTLPPYETLPVQYVVTVPVAIEGQPLEGTYWSMLMIESIASDSPESTLPSAPDEGQYGVRQVIRYGVQVASHVNGTGRRTVAFASPELVQEKDGSTSLRLNIENTGSLLIRPTVWVKLYDISGASRGRLEGTENRIYPGTSVQQRINLGDLPEGTYKALVVVDAGGDNVYGTEYTLELQ